MLAWLKAAPSGEILTVRCCLTLCSFVEVACEDDRAKHHAEVADEQQQRDADRPPLGALVVVNISDREIGARLVGRSAELAGDHCALHGPRRVPDLDRSAREVARESILVEEHGAMVLSDHVEVLRQGTVSDEARPLLCADHMPRSIKVRKQ